MTADRCPEGLSAKHYYSPLRACRQGAMPVMRRVTAARRVAYVSGSLQLPPSVIPRGEVFADRRPAKPSATGMIFLFSYCSPKNAIPINDK
jgi:hypothetical protein